MSRDHHECRECGCELERAYDRPTLCDSCDAWKHAGKEIDKLSARIAQLEAENAELRQQLRYLEEQSTPWVYLR